MTTIAVLRRHSDNLAQRRLRTGGDHARTDPSSHHRTQPATATLSNLYQQAALVMAAGRVIGRSERLHAPALAPFPSVKSP
jgi:hypothetical protein